MKCGRSKSGRRRTLCHADIDNFIQSIDAVSSKTPIGIEEDHISTVPVIESGPLTDVDLIRRYCKLKNHKTGTEEQLSIGKSIIESSNYCLLPSRTLFPEKYSLPPSSLEAKKALLMSLQPMLTQSEKQRKDDVMEAEKCTRCQVIKSRSRNSSYEYKDLDLDTIIPENEYEKRYRTYIASSKTTYNNKSHESFRSDEQSKAQTAKHTFVVPSQPKIEVQAAFLIDNDIDKENIDQYNNISDFVNDEERKADGLYTVRNKKRRQERRGTLSPATARAMMIKAMEEQEPAIINSPIRMNDALKNSPTKTPTNQVINNGFGVGIDNSFIPSTGDCSGTVIHDPNMTATSTYNTTHDTSNDIGTDLLGNELDALLADIDVDNTDADADGDSFFDDDDCDETSASKRSRKTRNMRRQSIAFGPALQYTMMETTKRSTKEIINPPHVDHNNTHLKCHVDNNTRVKSHIDNNAHIECSLPQKIPHTISLTGSSPGCVNPMVNSQEKSEPYTLPHTHSQEHCELYCKHESTIKTIELGSGDEVVDRTAMTTSSSFSSSSSSSSQCQPITMSNDGTLAHTQSASISNDGEVHVQVADSDGNDGYDNSTDDGDCNGDGDGDGIDNASKKNDANVGCPVSTRSTTETGENASLVEQEESAVTECPNNSINAATSEVCVLVSDIPETMVTTKRSAVENTHVDDGRLSHASSLSSLTRSFFDPNIMDTADDASHDSSKSFTTTDSMLHVIDASMLAPGPDCLIQANPLGFLEHVDSQQHIGGFNSLHCVIPTSDDFHTDVLSKDLSVDDDGIEDLKKDSLGVNNILEVEVDFDRIETKVDVDAMLSSKCSLSGGLIIHANESNEAQEVCVENEAEVEVVSISTCSTGGESQCTTDRTSSGKTIEMTNNNSTSDDVSVDIENVAFTNIENGENVNDSERTNEMLIDKCCSSAENSEEDIMQQAELQAYTRMQVRFQQIKWKFVWEVVSVEAALKAASLSRNVQCEF